MARIFISYRRADAAAVAGRLFDHLRNHFGRKNVFRDIDAIEPGAEFAQVIAQRIGECDALVVMIGKDWLDARDAEGRRRLNQPHDLVAAEISEALAQHKLVIPALIEGTSMPVPEALPPGIASLTRRHAILISDTRFDYDVSRLIAAVEKATAPHIADQEPPRLTGKELQNRRDLLDDVEREVADRLTRSLHSPRLINLRKEKELHQVRQTWDADIKVGHKRSTLLPPETGIVDVFDEDAIAGKLLILGAPGAGKTTALLQLAKELSARADRDLGVPMPVLLNLSSWRASFKILPAWLEAELKLKYGVRKDLSRRWLAERGLLLLLDGLDELEPAGQEGCVLAINEFQTLFRPRSLVVCCRQAEYQNLTAKLSLNGAISLQPLTNDQIRAHLASVGCSELWKSVEADAELMELARSPLLLSIMMLVYEGRSTEGWQELGSGSVRQRYLFDLYIERMLSREKKGKKYPEKKTRRWLAWLAHRLKEQGQTEFLIENLQPTWLQSRAERWLYHFSVVVTVAMIFLAYMWLLIYPLDELVPKGEVSVEAGEKIAALIKSLEVGRSQFWGGIILLIAAIAGLIVGLRQTIKPIETLRWSGTRARKGMLIGLQRWSIAGLRYGAYVGFIAGLGYSVFKDAIAGRSVVSERIGQIGGVICGLIGGAFTLLMARATNWRTYGFRDRLAVPLADALISALIVGSGSLLWFIQSGGLWNLVGGLLFALNVGIIAALSHGLRNRPVFTVGDAVVVALIGWLLSGLVAWLTDGLLAKFWMVVPLPIWIGTAVAAALIAGLIAKIGAKGKPVETVQGAEAQVWRWLALKWRRWVIAGLTAALIWSSLSGLLIALGQIQIAKAIALTTLYLAMGLVGMLGVSLFGALASAAMAAFLGGLFGALLGALREGLTGPDIERRTIPNQGIRQSAINIWIFAFLSGLTLGSIWMLLNLAVGTLITGLAPQASDWLSFGLGSVLGIAFFGALIPAAACIQHFALRFILWSRGVVPWNYARFLDYATEGMLLQRIGGRYRFMHDLLRDHFAATERDGSSVHAGGAVARNKHLL